MKLFKNFFILFFIISIAFVILNGAPNKEKKLERKKKHGKNTDLDSEKSIPSIDSDGIVNHIHEEKNSASEKSHHHKHLKKDRKIKKDKKIKKIENNSKSKEKKNKKKCNCKNKKDKKKLENRSKNGKKIN